MADNGRGTGDGSPGKLDRFLSRLSRTMTPPKMGIRTRRGGSPAQPLDMAVNGAQTDEAKDGLFREKSVRSETLRKRERVAELRKQREQKASQRKSRTSAVSPGAANLVNLAEMAAAGSPIPHTGMYGSQSLDMQRDRQGAEARLESDEFFNNPELNLLMQPLDLESAIADAESIPPSQRAKQRGKRAALAASSSRGPASTPVKNEFDFTINIPSTTLSPLVPGGADRRQRSRTAVFMADSAVAIDTMAGNGQRGQRSHTFLNVAQVAESTKRSNAVYRQIEAEMAQNEALKRELAQLDATVKALERLVVAGHSLRAVREAC
ncbi:hypothetical protein IWW43_004744 [Coemansia sp. RSA 1935]|nr:hypothetical protein IWW43_004744 [Coemansia sp. RSA 1935]